MLLRDFLYAKKNEQEMAIIFANHQNQTMVTCKSRREVDNMNKVNKICKGCSNIATYFVVCPRPEKFSKSQKEAQLEW